MSSLFDDLPLLKKAFSTPHPDYEHLGLKPDFVLIDRGSTEEQHREIAIAETRGLVTQNLVEIDEQETQLRYYLTDLAREALGDGS